MTGYPASIVAVNRATLDQRRDQMLSDETAAASDEYPCHACERGSAWRFSA